MELKKRILGLWAGVVDLYERVALCLFILAALLFVVADAALRELRERDGGGNTKKPFPGEDTRRARAEDDGVDYGAG